MLFCITLPNFVKIGASNAEIWRYIHFSRWRPRPLNTTSGFVFVDVFDVTAFSMSKSISKANFVDISQFTAEIWLLPFLKNESPPYWNSTSGFDVYHFFVIPVLFCIRLPNFVQMGAPTAEIWCHINSSRWRPLNICWCRCLQRVEVCQQTKFRRHISIHGRDITTSGLEKQTSAILEFYFWFRSRPFRRNRRVILLPAAEFRPNRNFRRWNMTSYRFLRWRPSAMLYLLWGNGGPPRSAFRGPYSVLKSLLRRSNSSGDIVM